MSDPIVLWLQALCYLQTSFGAPCVTSVLYAWQHSYLWPVSQPAAVVHLLILYLQAPLPTSDQPTPADTAAVPAKTLQISGKVMGAT
jgi:hypothetical protein